MLDNLVRIPGMATLESEIAVISGSRRESRDPGRGRFQGQPRRLPTEMPQILSSGFSAFLRTIRSTFHRGTMRPTCGCVEFYRFGRVSSCRWERFSNIPRRTANDDSPKRDRRKMAPTCFDGRLTWNGDVDELVEEFEEGTHAHTRAKTPKNGLSSTKRASDDEQVERTGRTDAATAADDVSGALAALWVHATGGRGGSGAGSAPRSREPLLPNRPSPAGRRRGGARPGHVGPAWRRPTAAANGGGAGPARPRPSAQGPALLDAVDI